MIRIEGQYDLDDFKQAVALADVRPWFYRVQQGVAQVIVLLIAAFMLPFLLRVPVSIPTWAFLPLLLLLIALWFLVVKPWLLARAFSRSGIMSQPFEIALNEDSFSLSNANGLESVKWSQLLAWRESADLFVFRCIRLYSQADGIPEPETRRLWTFVIFLYRFYTGRHFHIIPKRFVRSENDLAYVRECLSARRVPPEIGTAWSMKPFALMALNFVVLGVIVFIIVGLIALALRR